MKFLKSAFYFCLFVWIFGAIVTFEYATEKKQLEMILKISSTDVFMLNFRSIAINLFGSLSILLGITRLSLWFFEKRSKARNTKEKEKVQTSDGTSAQGISLKPRPKTIDGRFAFDFSYDTNVMQLNFESVSALPDERMPLKKRDEGGFLRIHRDNEEAFVFEFLLWPFDMISEGCEDEYIELIRKFDVNHLSIKLTKISREEELDVTSEYSLFLNPKAVSEEGWHFLFSEAPMKSIGRWELAIVSFSSIIEKMSVCKSIELSLGNYVRTSQKVFEATKVSGHYTEFASLSVAEMDKFREIFAKAFGEVTLKEFASKEGLEIG